MARLRLCVTDFLSREQTKCPPELLADAQTDFVRGISGEHLNIGHACLAERFLLHGVADRCGSLSQTLAWATRWAVPTQISRFVHRRQTETDRQQLVLLA